MSVRLAVRDMQIRSFQTGFHEGRTGRRHPDVVQSGFFDAAVKYFHDAFVCRFRSTRNPPGEKDDFAIGTMSTDLLHELSHRLWEIWWNVRLADSGWPPAKMPSVHDDIIPNLSELNIWLTASS